MCRTSWIVKLQKWFQFSNQRYGSQKKKTNELSAARRGSEGDTSGPEVGVAGRLRGVELPYERM